MSKKKWIVASLLFILGFIAMLYLAWDKPKNPSEKLRIRATKPEFWQNRKKKETCTIMGPVSNHRLTSNGLVLVIKDQEVILTNQTEIIVTDLTHHTREEVNVSRLFNMMNMHPVCNAAVGVEDGQVEMAIVYPIHK